MVANPLQGFAKHFRTLRLGPKSYNTAVRSMAGSSKKAIEALIKLGKAVATMEVGIEWGEMKKADHRAKRTAQAEEVAKELVREQPPSPSGKPPDSFTGSPEDLFESTSLFDLFLNPDNIAISVCLFWLLYSLAFIIAARRLTKVVVDNQDAAKEAYRKALETGALNFMLVAGGLISSSITSSLKDYAEKVDESALLNNTIPPYSSWSTYIIDSDWFFIIVAVFIYSCIFLLHYFIKSKGTFTKN